MIARTPGRGASTLSLKIEPTAAAAAVSAPSSQMVDAATVDEASHDEADHEEADVGGVRR